MMAMNSSLEFDSGGGGTGVLVPTREPRRKRDSGGDLPPIDWDDFGGGGGGGGGDDDAEGGDESEEERGFDAISRADLGLSLGLVAISSLFLIFFAAYVFLARSAEAWPPLGSPRASLGLWLSTASLVVSSLCIARAKQASLRMERDLLLRWVLGTLFFGVLFIGLQLAVWRELHGAGLLPSSNGYGAIFYTLTGMHALHVLGGIVALASLTGRLWSGQELSQDSVRLCGVYWHFMGVIWIVLFSVL